MGSTRAQHKIGRLALLRGNGHIATWSGAPERQGCKASPGPSPLVQELPSRTWDFTETDLTGITSWDFSDRHGGWGAWRRLSG